MKGASDRARSRLSPDRILTTAVTIADREGLVAVSMRRLARELAVTPMALYWHFADKDRLIDAMAERVVARGEFQAQPGVPWDGQLRATLTALVELLHDHPWMGRPVIERLVHQPNYLGAMEVLLDSTRRAGLSPEQCAIVVQQAVQAVVVLAECGPTSDRDTSGAPADLRTERQFLDDLPAEQYPQLRQAAEALTTLPDTDTYYRLGLDMIIGGIRAIADDG